MRPFTFEKAESLAEALKMKTKTKSFLAGGTNLVDLLKKNIVNPDAVIDVAPALSTSVEFRNNILTIGAMTKNTDLTLDKNILKNAPLVAKAVMAGASPQIRNMASTAGNLLQRTRCAYFYDLSAPCNKRNPNSGCSALKGDHHNMAIIGYSDACIATHPSDLCVALSALDANVKVADSQKNLKVIPFKDFHKLPENTPWLDNNLPENAVITHVEIPQNVYSKNFAYVKIRERSSYAFALISVAAAMDLEGGKIKSARLASGGVAHKPWRWYDAEKFLEGKTPTADVFSKAAEIAAEKVKPLRDNTYKVALLKGAIETALLDAFNQKG